jgi:predicted RNA methylase
LNGGTRNGDIRNIFVNNIYEHLPVEGRSVVDIGANIADSCIYFALHGANNVIGLEPFPRNYELAEKKYSN